MFAHTLRSAARTTARKQTARYTSYNHPYGYTYDSTTKLYRPKPAIIDNSAGSDSAGSGKIDSGLTIFGIIGTVYFFCGGQDRKLCSLKNDILLLNRKIDALNKNFGTYLNASHATTNSKTKDQKTEMRGGDEADDADTQVPMNDSRLYTTLPHSFEPSQNKRDTG